MAPRELSDHRALRVLGTSLYVNIYVSTSSKGSQNPVTGINPAASIQVTLGEPNVSLLFLLLLIITIVIITEKKKKERKNIKYNNGKEKKH